VAQCGTLIVATAPPLITGSIVTRRSSQAFTPLYAAGTSTPIRLGRTRGPSAYSNNHRTGQCYHDRASPALPSGNQSVTPTMGTFTGTESLPVATLRWMPTAKFARHPLGHSRLPQSATLQLQLQVIDKPASILTSRVLYTISHHPGHHRHEYGLSGT
jgi:hypothetical protein